LLWLWYVFVLLCNVYAIILWGTRLSSSTQQYYFIHSRLSRTARPEIPRFRFDFKHAKRDVGDYVQRALVDAFLNEYLEPDGYFFIRLLAANASDFIVQEVLEQLWTMYVMKYGEADAKRAEDEFFEFRQHPTISQSFSQISRLSLVDKSDRLTDSERKYLRQHSDIGVALLEPAILFQPIISQQNEPV
jgi:hypothetical protein